MNIKLEINGEQFEINLQSDGNCIYHADGFIEDDSNWSYELFLVGQDGELLSMADDNRAEDACEAASWAISHLIGVLTNDDHSIED